MHSGVAVAGRAGCGCCGAGTGAVCWVSGRGSRVAGCSMTVVDLPRRPQTVVDLPTSRRRVAGVHRPPSRRRHRRWSTSHPGAARRRRLAVAAVPAAPAHDPCCQVGDDPRDIIACSAWIGGWGGCAASGWDRRGRSGHRRCHCRDGGRCTPATRRRDVGRSTTVWGGGGRSTTVTAGRRPAGPARARAAESPGRAPWSRSPHPQPTPPPEQIPLIFDFPVSPGRTRCPRGRSSRSSRR